MQLSNRHWATFTKAGVFYASQCGESNCQDWHPIYIKVACLLVTAAHLTPLTTPVNCGTYFYISRFQICVV